MRVKVITRKQVDEFKVVEFARHEEVGEFKFKSGDLYYFKKDNYNYNVLSFNPVGKCFVR